MRSILDGLTSQELSQYLDMKLYRILVKEGFTSLKVTKKGLGYKIRSHSIKMNIEISV
jgi:hypothetical protein